MFERRVKIVVAIVVCFALTLIVRAAQVQIAQHAEWSRQAIDDAERTAYTDAPRGRILDVKGRVLAVDEWCLDARIDYRVIPSDPDAGWLREKAKARARLTNGYGSIEREEREKRIAENQVAIRQDLEAMWNALALASGKPRSEIDERRREIVEKVENRQQIIWQSRYDKALSDYQSQPRRPGWQRWFLGETVAPKPTDFHQPIGEQLQSHIVLWDLSVDASNQLTMQSDRFGGALTLTPSIARRYPYNEVAAHVIGRLSPVQKPDLEGNAGRDPRRRYRVNDLIGRQGIELIAEERLRGTLGVSRTNRRQNKLTAADAPTPGQDVQTSIDIELQRDIQHAFEHVGFSTPEKKVETMPMPGAAVVIDIPTGQVRALVSYPSFDLNHYDDHYPQLSQSDIQRPLMNRATMFAMEPGSTVKPIIGLAAITQGLIGVNDTIECTGHLILDGRTIEEGGRCWTLSSADPPHTHHSLGRNPHPNGFLTYADAIERSCNVYFETLGDQLKIEGVSYWFSQFGLGEPTGIGLGENAGILPNRFDIPSGERRSTAFYAAIGQDKVNATPIQDANYIATLARDGLWMKPRLFTDPTLDPTPQIVSQRQIKLDAGALRALHEGMKNVVNNDSGTGRQAQRDDILLAAKTGTATAAALTLPQRGADGELLRDENGRTIGERLAYGTTLAPNPLAPWYREINTKKHAGGHSWYVGYAPADDPKIAFAVFIEYGGSGGAAAGSVAKILTQSLIDRGYLPGKTTDQLAAGQ